jgi:hypothetical protein
MTVLYIMAAFVVGCVIGWVVCDDFRRNVR